MVPFCGSPGPRGKPLLFLFLHITVTTVPVINRVVTVLDGCLLTQVKETTLQFLFFFPIDFCFFCFIVLPNVRSLVLLQSLKYYLYYSVGQVMKFNTQGVIRKYELNPVTQADVRFLFNFFMGNICYHSHNILVLLLTFC